MAGRVAVFDYYRAIPETIRQNSEHFRKPLAMPVLTIGAQHATRDAPFESMKHHVLHIRGEIIEDCGYFIAEERPEAFLSLLVPFLREA